MAVQINVAANQAALTASIQAGVQAYNQRFAQNNQINLSINQRGFSQPLGRITGDVKDFEAALAASNARVIAFGASTAVLGGVIRSFKELANVTIEVEKNLADINRVFGLTTSQLQKFSTDLFNVTKLTASSFDDASKAALEFSRQGLKAEDTLQRTKDALTLTRLAGISTANAVDALTSTVNGFAATGISTTQILNKLVAVEQDYAVGAGDLAEALSRTGQAAQEAGVSLDQLNALVTSAQQSTARGGAVIGNALKTIFTRLQRTDTLDQLEAFNISVRDVQGNILPAVQILQNFAGAYKGLADAQRAQLSEQVAGVYQVNILKAIVNDLNKSQGTYAGALQRGAAATNEAEVATAKLNQTLDALLKQTATSTQQLANNIGKVTFEPLAKYGTEQLKSFIESLNEVLEGEGVGSTFANGLLKGIRNVIAGPGAIAAFFTLFKLIQNSFTYLSQALPQIAGITTETQNRKNIEQSILQIMQQQGPVSQALAGNMGNQAAQAQLLLQVARQQTAEYQMQTTLAKQLAAQLATQGVRVKGSGGLQVTRAGGYIPNATRMAEVVGAQAGGYTPGRVVSSPVGGVMNTAEDVKYIPGFAQPFINPPAGSKAGRAHRQKAINRTGVDPYMYRGFIPNFFADAKKSKLKQSLERGRDFEKLVGEYIGEPPSWNGAVDFKVVPNIPDDTSLGFNKGYYDSGTFADAHSGLGHTNPQIAGKIIRHSKLTYKNLLQHSNEDFWFDGNELVFVPDFTEIIGKGQDDEFLNKTKISSLSSDSKSEFLKGLSREEMQKAMNQKILLHYYKDRVNLSGGFIPNFAPPTSAIRIPWFKKFGNPAFDTIQPALGISKASDTETFRQINFKSTAEGADENGDSNIFGPLYETFSRKALQLINKSNIFGEFVRGSALQPKAISSQTAFDEALLQKEEIVAFDFKGFPKKNLSSGSVTKHLNDKFNRVVKTDPEKAAKIKESIMAFNETGHESQLPSQFGKNFLELAGTSYSQMLKNSPSLVKALSAETDSLLNNYVKNPAFLAMAAASGFIPNFNGKKVNTPFWRTKTGPGDIFPKEGTGLSGTNARKPGERLYGYMLEEAWNNMVMSILGNNVFMPDASSLNPRLVGDVNEAAQRSAKSAALNLSSAGRTTSLGLGRGMSENFGNSRYVPNPDAVYTGKVSGKMKKVNYDRLSKVLGVFWSSNPETKSAWDFLKNYAESGKFVDKKEIKSRTSLLRKSYEDWLIKNSYIGTQVKLSDYRKRGEGVGAVNYAALRSDLAGVSNLQNLGEMEKLKKYKEQGIFYGDYKNNKAMYDKMGRWTYNAASKKMILNSASGFIPNFAYKQAVMGLEESMSGNKAIFDTKPFPHIRNSSQPTFSSAIADHGGLGNALSDSMRGQKAAGLMSGGFVPNFAKKGKGGKKGKKNTQTNAPASMSDDDIEKAISDFINSVQSADEKLGIFESAFGGRTKLIDSGLLKLKDALSKGGVSGQKLNDALDKAGKDISKQQSKLGKGLEKSSTTLAIAGPLIAGQLEQAIYGNRERIDMTASERQGQAALSTGLTAISTGASIGSAFGPVGAGIGAAAGVLIGFISSVDAAKLSLAELTKIDQELLQKQQANSQAASSYIDNQNKLNDLISSGASQKDIQDATKNLSLSFNDIKDVKLAEIFAKTAGNVEKMKDALSDYTDDLTRKSAGKAALGNLQEGAGVFSRLFLGGKTTAEMGVKDTSEVAAQLFRSSSSFTDPKLFETMRAGAYKDLLESQNRLKSNRVGGAVPGLRSDAGNLVIAQKQYAEKFTKEMYPQLEKGTAEFEQQVQRFIDLLFGKSGTALAEGLETITKLEASNTAIQKVRTVALRGFAVIFGEIEQAIQVNALKTAIALEKDLQKNRIDSAINNFVTNFNESIESFVLNSLPEGANKLKFTQFSTQRKYDDAISKQQIAAEDFRLSQQKERNDYQQAREEKLTKLFKDVSLQSEQSANFYKTSIYEKVKSGDFSQLSSKAVSSDLEQKLIAQAKLTGTEALSKSQTLKRLLSESNIDFTKINLNDEKQVSRISEIAGEAQKQTGIEYPDLKEVIAGFQNSLSDLYNTQEFFSNKAKKLEYDSAIEIAKLEGDQFNQRMENAKKLFEINQVLEKTQLQSAKILAVEKAKIDNENMIRMKSMEAASKRLGFGADLFKAQREGRISDIERNLSDPRLEAGLGVKEITERRIKAEREILEERRKIEDQALATEMAQAQMQLLAEIQNTNALEQLTKAVLAMTSSSLITDLGGQDQINKIEEYIRNQSSTGQLGEATSMRDINFDVDKEFGKGSYGKYLAYKRNEEQRQLLDNNAANIANMRQQLKTSGNFTDQQLDYNNLENLAKQNPLLAEQVRLLKEQYENRTKILEKQRESVNKDQAQKDALARLNASFVGNMALGLGSLKKEGGEILLRLARDIPRMFADGLVDGIKAAIRESDNLGEALMGIASKFLDEISTAMMRSAIYGMLGSVGMGIPGIGQALGGKQKGGIIRAQSGMYISGTGSGDKYPALLENGEYVLNRNAVMAMGGPAEIDKLNFSMAPRFASGGSYSAELTDLKSMEEGMTTAGLENSKLYGELRDIERQKQEAKRQKRRQRKQMIAGIVGAVAGAAASFGINKAISSLPKSAANLETNASLLGSPEQMTIINGRAVMPGGHQTGGLIGSRLSDTIPAYAEGGLYNTPIVKKYGVGLQNGGMGSSVNNSNVVNNSNATNSFNFNTNVNRDGTIEVGSSSTSYKQQDVELSQNLNNKIYGAVLGVIKDQQRFGGSLAGTRRAT